MTAAHQAAVRRALQAGDVDELVRLHDGLLCWIADRYFIAGADRDDVRQVARLGFVQALYGYDGPGEPGPLLTFVRVVVERRLIDAVQRGNRGKHRLLTDATSLDAPVEADDGALDRHELVACRQPTAHEQLETKEELALIIQRAEALTDVERHAFQRVTLDGDPYDQVDGLSVKVVDNALQRARRKLAGEPVRPPRRELAQAA